MNLSIAVSNMAEEIAATIKDIGTAIGAIAPTLGVIFLAIQSRKNAADSHEERMVAIDMATSAKRVAEDVVLKTDDLAQIATDNATKLDEVATKVDGHLTKITEALTKEAKLGIALTVENDRLNEGTTTVPVAQTPEVKGGYLVRDPGSGEVTLNERRQDINWEGESK